MNRTDDRLLPVLLICVQAAVWPGAELVRGDVPPASALLVAVLVAGPVTAALVLRRAVARRRDGGPRDRGGRAGPVHGGDRTRHLHRRAVRRRARRLAASPEPQPARAQRP